MVLVDEFGDELQVLLQDCEGEGRLVRGDVVLCLWAVRLGDGVCALPEEVELAVQVVGSGCEAG